MAFAYYKRRTHRQQGIYRKSNEMPAVPLPNARAVQTVAHRLEVTLPGGDRHAVQELVGFGQDVDPGQGEEKGDDLVSDGYIWFFIGHRVGDRDTLAARR